MKNFAICFESSKLVATGNEAAPFGKAYDFWAQPSPYLTAEQSETEAAIRKYVVCEELLKEESVNASMVVITNSELAAKVDAKIAKISKFIADNNASFIIEEMGLRIEKAMQSEVFVGEDKLSDEAESFLQAANNLLFGTDLTPKGLLRRASHSRFNQAYKSIACFSFGWA